MIRLEGVGKTYPDGTVAVHDLDLDVPGGMLVCLVGPSGCGKSTTLKMVNRLIEPTSGRILLEGEDVTHGDPVKLRRRMGYVIQQTGLFPHQNIAANVATVPKLLGWDRKKVNDRVNELLELVGLDPGTYRSRYPAQLSGGQRQRVGVARALAADPPVLLMDEPFGAIDPVNRARLQDEFLRLQRELQKTIVFVTHDIDEAIKMGDRIAILQEQSVIAQHDTPERILAHPKSKFVEDFLGSGATLKGLNLMRAGEVELDDVTTIQAPTSRDAVLEAIESSGDQWVLMLDEKGIPKRWLNRRSLDGTESLDEAGKAVQVTVEPEDTLRDALEKMLQSAVGTACCVNPDGSYRGVVRVETLVALIDQLQTAERDRQAAMS
jgi:osmoprotectant transport system ATP-binding protein